MDCNFKTVVGDGKMLKQANSARDCISQIQFVYDLFTLVN